MRLRPYLAAIVASVLAAALAAGAPASAAGEVLTVGGLGGPAVGVGEHLYGHLKPGTVASFLSNLTGSAGVQCSRSEFVITALTNPTAPSSATGSLDSVTFDDCTSNVFGVLSVKSVKVDNLPYDVAVDSVTKVATITPRANTYIQTSLVLNTLLGQITCVYRADGNKLTGWVDNADSSANFSNQKFNKYSGPGTCFSVGYFSASYVVTNGVGIPVFVN